VRQWTTGPIHRETGPWRHAQVRVLSTVAGFAADFDARSCCNAQPRTAKPKRCLRGQPPGGSLGRLLLDTPPELVVPMPTDRPASARWPIAIWRRGDVVRATIAASLSDRVSLTAAGCAFYATLALFPAISILISIYGLAFNPRNVEVQLQSLQELLPPPAFQLIAERVHHLVVQPRARLSFGLGIGTLLTFWSAATGTKSVISALNLAYGATERRGIVRFQLVGFGLTLSAILVAVLGIAVLVFLPACLRVLGVVQFHTRIALLHWIGLLMLVGFASQAIALLYRFGPSRRAPPTRWILPGTLLATALWLVASALLDFYIDHIGTFGATYGPIGAVVGIMLWFYVSVYAVLLGAELNAQLEGGASV
jgi:membrane protein